MKSTAATDLLPPLICEFDNMLCTMKTDSEASEFSSLTETSVVSLTPDQASGNVKLMRVIQRRFRKLQKKGIKKPCEAVWLVFI